MILSLAYFPRPPPLDGRLERRIWPKQKFSHAQKCNENGNPLKAWLWTKAKNCLVHNKNMPNSACLLCPNVAIESCEKSFCCQEHLQVLRNAENGERFPIEIKRSEHAGRYASGVHACIITKILKICGDNERCSSWRSHFRGLAIGCRAKSRESNNLLELLFKHWCKIILYISRLLKKTLKINNCEFCPNCGYPFCSIECLKDEVHKNECAVLTQIGGFQGQKEENEVSLINESPFQNMIYRLTLSIIT